MGCLDVSINPKPVGMGRKEKKKKPIKSRDDDDGDSKSSLREERNEDVENQAEIAREMADPRNCELRGLKKWLATYYAKRPGIAVLQQQVDKFIADYEARVDQEKSEKMAAAADDGWTVVEHKGGRKKTTDVLSGIKVGGVAAAAAQASASRKEKQQVTLDFYRFQRREARRNDVLELQKRFEDDKKRITKMRASRKFRPY